MAQFHRNLGHDYNAYRAHINYALFGNTRGIDAPARPKVCWPARSDDERRADKWRVRWCIEDVRRVRNIDHNPRAMDEAWLRWKEIEG